MRSGLTAKQLHILGGRHMATFKNAIAYAVENSVGLTIPPGDYDFTEWAAGDLLAITGTLRIVAHPGAHITGPGPTVSGADLFSVVNGSIDISGGIWDGWRRVIDYPDGNTAQDMRLRLTRARFRNHAVIVRSQAVQTATVGLIDSLEILGCEFSARQAGGVHNAVDVLFGHLNVRALDISHNRGIDGGDEAFAFTQDSPRWLEEALFIGNRLRNYTNRVGGGDNDAHFIRVASSIAGRGRVIIAQNILDGLYVAEGFGTGDTEGIRVSANDILITENIMRDAGLGEGVVVVKSGETVEVSRNLLEITDGYKTFNTAHEASDGSWGIVRSGTLVKQMRVAGNTLRGFDNVPIYPGEGEADDLFEAIDNKIIDCPADKAEVSCGIRISGGGVGRLRGNIITTTDDGTPILPTISVFAKFVTDGSIDSAGNRWRATDRHFSLGDNNATLDFSSVGDSFQGGDHWVQSEGTPITFGLFILLDPIAIGIFSDPINLGTGVTLSDVHLRVAGQKQTVDASTGQRFAFDMPIQNGHAYNVRWEATGSGASPAHYQFHGLYTAAAGSASLQGAITTTVVVEADAAFTDAEIAMATNILTFRLGGKAATTIDWKWAAEIRGYKA